MNHQRLVAPNSPPSSLDCWSPPGVHGLHRRAAHGVGVGAAESCLRHRVALVVTVGERHDGRAQRAVLVTRSRSRGW